MKSPNLLHEGDALAFVAKELVAFWDMLDAVSSVDETSTEELKDMMDAKIDSLRILVEQYYDPERRASFERNP